MPIETPDIEGIRALLGDIDDRLLRSSAEFHRRRFAPVRSQDGPRASIGCTGFFSRDPQRATVSIGVMQPRSIVNEYYGSRRGNRERGISQLTRGMHRCIVRTGRLSSPAFFYPGRQAGSRCCSHDPLRVSISLTRMVHAPFCQKTNAPVPGDGSRSTEPITREEYPPPFTNALDATGWPPRIVMYLHGFVEICRALRKQLYNNSTSSA